MKWKSNERGLTLVELLAALALFGIFSVFIWNFFFQGLINNERAVTQNQLQQEANLIVNTIQQMHTRNKIESIYIENPGADNYGSKMNVTAFTLPDSVNFNKKNIEYKINGPITITGNVFNLELSLRSKSVTNIKFETKTTFSKLSSNSNDGN